MRVAGSREGQVWQSTLHRYSWTGVPNRGLIMAAAPQVCKGNPLYKARTFGLSDINPVYCLLFKTQVLSSPGFSLFHLEHFAWVRLQHLKLLSFLN